MIPSGSPYAKLITGTAYTVGPLDLGNVLVFTSNSPIAVSLPPPGSGGSFERGSWVSFVAAGSGIITVTPAQAPFPSPNTPTINGAASLAISDGLVTIFQDQSGNYRGLVDSTTPAVEAVGEITITGSSTALTLTSQNTFYLVPGPWGEDLTPVNVTQDTTGGTLVPLVAGKYQTLVTLAFTSLAAPETVQFQIFKNGSPIPDHVAISWTDTQTYPNTVTIVGVDRLAVNDILDLRAACLTAAGIALTVTDANFNIFRIGV